MSYRAESHYTEVMLAAMADLDNERAQVQALRDELRLLRDQMVSTGIGWQSSTNGSNIRPAGPKPEEGSGERAIPPQPPTRLTGTFTISQCSRAEAESTACKQIESIIGKLSYEYTLNYDQTGYSAVSGDGNVIFVAMGYGKWQASWEAWRPGAYGS